MGIFIAFVQIPHARFRDQLIYKCRAVGITVITVEESYTSKASFLDGDYIPTYGQDDVKTGNQAVDGSKEVCIRVQLGY